MVPVAFAQRVQSLLSTFGRRAPVDASAPTPRALASQLLRAFQGVNAFEPQPAPGTGLKGGDELPMTPKINIVDDFNPGLCLRLPGPVDTKAPLPTSCGTRRTRESAIEDAKELLLGHRENGLTQQGSLVTYDPTNSNAPADSLKHMSGKCAAKQVVANAVLEQKFLARLTPEQQGQYAKVKGLLKDHPVSQLGLQFELFRGRLTGRPDLLGKDTALAGLAKLADQELAPGINRRSLVSSLVKELALPASISQGHRGTCAATAVEMKLIHDNPAEYVRLVSGLASPSGKVNLASGHELHRVPGTNLEDGTKRSLPQRLIAPAFMDAADGSMTYDNKHDVHRYKGHAYSRGLTPGQVDRLLDNVYGQSYGCKEGINTPAEQKDAWSLLKKATDAHQEVLAGLQWTPSTRHKVVVLNVANDRVNYVNPWGRYEQMSKHDFLNRLRNVNYGSELKK